MHPRLLRCKWRRRTWQGEDIHSKHYVGLVGIGGERRKIKNKTDHTTAKETSAEANVDKSGKDNNNKCQETHFLGNKEVPGLQAKMKRKGRSADVAERKKTSADKSVEESREDSDPSPLAKKKLKKNIKSDTAVGKERKEGEGKCW